MKASKSKSQKKDSAKRAAGLPEGATVQPATVETVALNLLEASRGRRGARKSVRVDSPGFKPLGMQDPPGDASSSQPERSTAEPPTGSGTAGGAKCD